jgi:hypothetical protein
MRSAGALPLLCSGASGDGRGSESKENPFSYKISHSMDTSWVGYKNIVTAPVKPFFASLHRRTKPLRNKDRFEFLERQRKIVVRPWARIYRHTKGDGAHLIIYQRIWSSPASQIKAENLTVISYIRFPITIPE